ncbi:MAG TPA: hypothetical protein VF485_10000 [Sphingomonas sp.]
MTSTQPSGQLIRATAVAVKTWFHDAWPGRKDYPNEARNWEVATRINIIVDRANARSVKDYPADALKKRRKHYGDALKHARALERALQPIKNYLLYVKEQLHGFQAVEPKVPMFAREIAAVEEMERALREFLARCEAPSLRDHKDEISWIGAAAQKAWADTLADLPENQRKRLPLGLGPDGRLVGFVQLVLEGIGLPSAGRGGNSRAKISDHLRGRQNRKRDRKKNKK